ncbi:MAG: CCA-adding enzyme [Candidatus Omnitrophica bacterium ADurb.Bin292]|nr:MAG: CCA-adding enzyme [Candidatus Omnitrophica bacterium ADurb.Bin292]HQB12334.1 CCA tRNA nucleotidyltransferase [Candidatus Omnitrophota bacterium]
MNEIMDLASHKGGLALRIATALRDHGHTVFFVGGCVRDHLMGKQPEDIDIATTAKPAEVEAIFPKTIPVGKQFGVVIVMEDDIPFEVATFRAEGGYQDGRHPTRVEFTVPEDDARRRDFTVNGLFYDPFSQKVIDYVAGKGDVDAKLIRAIGDPDERFREDKLRLLRAIRFASTLGFEIERKTWDSIRVLAASIHAVSPERIRDELVKIFTRPGAARGFMLLHESGLMKEILPEVEAMKGVEQPEEFHPEGDVFEHTRILLTHLTPPVSEVLAFSALFHDVGKPRTRAIRKGRLTFYEHSEEGARIAREIMRRLRFSNDTIEGVYQSVLNHMKFMDVKKMRSGKLKMFVARPTFSDEMQLHRADCLASHGMLDNYEFLQEKMKEFEHEELKPKALVSGHDLIALGMKPGPEMKPLLGELYELQLEGAIKGREEALTWAKKKIVSLKSQADGSRAT